MLSSLVNQKNIQIVLQLIFARGGSEKSKILVRKNWRALSKYCTPGVADTKVQVPTVKILNSKKIKSTWMPLTLFILYITNGNIPPSHVCEYVLNILELGRVNSHDRKQSCSVSKDTFDLTVTRGTLWFDKLLDQMFPYWQNSFDCKPSVKMKGCKIISIV